MKVKMNFDSTCINLNNVYTCSLDAESAFDAIPHSILFYKAATVLPKALLACNAYLVF